MKSHDYERLARHHGLWAACGIAAALGITVDRVLATLDKLGMRPEFVIGGVQLFGPDARLRVEDDLVQEKPTSRLERLPLDRRRGW